MKILIFDTETTGLPLGINTSIYKTNKWPYIIQLSYILFDIEANKMLIEHDWIIKIPENVEINAKAESMHGISKDKSQKEGIEIIQALELFDICLSSADVVVGHNIKFDKQMIIVENIRNKRSSAFRNSTVREYCTMKHGVELCNIIKQSKFDVNKTYLKYPSQSELHLKLFNSLPCGTHNSWVDILICLRCYYKMTVGEDLYIKNNKFKNKFKAYI